MTNASNKKTKALMFTSLLGLSLMGPLAHAGLFDNIFGGGDDSQEIRYKPRNVPGRPVVVKTAPKQKQRVQVVVGNNGGDDQDVEAQRLAAEEARLGRPLTQMERETKIAMDKFDYQPALRQPILIQKTDWTEDDEIDFGDFVAQFGRGVAAGKCFTTTGCLHNAEVNRFADEEPASMVVYADCADLPYFLRAYYAYHRGLPFSYVTEIAINTVAYTSKDDQQKVLESAMKKGAMESTPYGNRIVARGGSNVGAKPGQERNFVPYIHNLINTTSTATNRVGPMTPGTNQSDIFPVALNSRGVRPGAVVAATGHAMMVYKVTPDGEIHIIDGHPGSFIQEHTLKNSMIEMSRPDQGIGYYQFRPMHLVGAQRASNGYYYSGRVVPASNDELINEGRYSLEQFFGAHSRLTPDDSVTPNQWKAGFTEQSVFNYLTANLSQAGVRRSADQAVKSDLNELCSKLQARVTNFSDSAAAGNSRAEHPASLPSDLYSAADANWEKYSTPAGDARLRNQVLDVVKSAIFYFRQSKVGDEHLYYQGSAQDYVATIRKLIGEQNANCKLAYTNSRGQKISLTLNEVTKRLNRLSFDPYMCPEKSWGAQGDEMATCRDQDDGNQWYDAEKYLRNNVGKLDSDGNVSIRSDRPMTLELLRDTDYINQPSTAAISLGTDKAPLMNLDGSIASDWFLQKLIK